MGYGNAQLWHADGKQHQWFLQKVVWTLCSSSSLICDIRKAAARWRSKNRFCSQLLDYMLIRQRDALLIVCWWNKTVNNTRTCSCLMAASHSFWPGAIVAATVQTVISWLMLSETALKWHIRTNGAEVVFNSTMTRCLQMLTSRRNTTSPILIGLCIHSAGELCCFPEVTPFNTFSLFPPSNFSHFR